MGSRMIVINFQSNKVIACARTPLLYTRRRNRLFLCFPFNVACFTHESQNFRISFYMILACTKRVCDGYLCIAQSTFPTSKYHYTCAFFFAFAFLLAAFDTALQPWTFFQRSLNPEPLTLVGLLCSRVEVDGKKCEVCNKLKRISWTEKVGTKKLDRKKSTDRISKIIMIATFKN